MVLVHLKKEKVFQNDPKKIRLEDLRDIYSHSGPLKVIGGWGGVGGGPCDFSVSPSTN